MQLAHDSVDQDVATVLEVVDLVGLPELTELRAALVHGAQQCPQLGIIGPVAGAQPEVGGDMARDQRPAVGGQGTNPRIEEDQIRPIALRIRHFREVDAEQRHSGRVPAQDLGVVPDDVRGRAGHGVEQLLQARPQRLSRPGQGARWAGQIVQVAPLVAAQVQRGGDGVDDPLRNRFGAALFQPDVVLDADPGQVRDLLAPQPRHPSPTPYR
ncbi:hypothetical protein GCM10027167_34850 [Nocardia heshunensis]